MYQPDDNVVLAGSVNVPAPLVHTNVVARDASLIVGATETRLMLPVVASNPAEVTVKPAPLKLQHLQLMYLHQM